MKKVGFQKDGVEIFKILRHVYTCSLQIVYLAFTLARFVTETMRRAFCATLYWVRFRIVKIIGRGSERLHSKHTK